MKCDNPECNNAEMTVAFVRDDGCRLFVCPNCQQEVGEETEDWFKQQRAYERTIANQRTENR